MAEPVSWVQMRDRRMAEPGADAAYEAARLAFELGAAVWDLRLAREWNQAGMATAAGMTHSAVARFEAGERSRHWGCWGASRVRWMLI